MSRPVTTRERFLPTLIAGLSLLLLALVLAVVLHGGGTDDAGGSVAAGSSTGGGDRRAALPLLPRGGRVLLPAKRVVSFAGAPQDPALGALGVGSLGGAVRRLERQGRTYSRPTRPDQPALQLISTIAHAAPGRDGRYSLRQPASVIARHLRAARRARALLILDVQPGRASFVAETAHLARWLREPDVALALDPEWRMEHAGDVPGEVIGSVGAPELQRTLDAVAKIVRDDHLPPKLVIVHRFTQNMVRGLSTVRVPPEVQAVMSIDGVGDRANKVAKYHLLTADLPPRWRPGFKVFYEEDRAAGGLMTPRQVMGLRPRPDVVLYE